MIRRFVAWLAGFWGRYYDRKVEQARAPQMPELDWIKERAGRIEKELKTARHGQGEAWRMR